MQMTPTNDVFLSECNLLIAPHLISAYALPLNLLFNVNLLPLLACSVEVNGEKYHI